MGDQVEPASRWRWAAGSNRRSASSTHWAAVGVADGREPSRVRFSWDRRDTSRGCGRRDDEDNLLIRIEEIQPPALGDAPRRDCSQISDRHVAVGASSRRGPHFVRVQDEQPALGLELRALPVAVRRQARPTLHEGDIRAAVSRRDRAAAHLLESPRRSGDRISVRHIKLWCSAITRAVEGAHRWGDRSARCVGR
ncbi:MAG: hypothetical protein JWM86_745 [Thermoleophilia bacterium]|nr:hypothetical protein [Thermoleophilia bacterium]